ncbi:MAG: ATP-binding protein [Sandaracinaceae bacterium]|nr:MAG: response regulator [Sandaracinaceae bacterium]
MPENDIKALQHRVAALSQRIRELESAAEEAEETRQALALSEQRFRLAFQTSPDAISLTRAQDGMLVDVNGGFTEITGWTREEAIGATSVEMELWVDVETRRRMATEIEERGVVRNLEAQFRRKDGSILWGLFSARALMLDGELHLMSVARDIDAWRRAEREREELREALQEAQRLESIARLASGVAHDFNNMLTVIRGFTGLLSKQLRDEALRAEVDEIDHAATRAAELTRQLLAFGRRQVLLPRTVSLSDLVRRMRKMLRRLLPASIAIEVDLAEDDCPVHADPGQLEQVIANLAVNARDAMPAGGTLTLAVRGASRDERDWVIVEVRDDGVGMDDETLARIFEPFFTTKSPDRGTGLGLSSVDGVVHQSGGFMEVDSAPHQGSSFRIWLPRATGALDEDTQRQSQIPAVGGGEHLLVVEDEPSLRRVLDRTLAGLGYRVTTASSAEEALRLAGRMDAPPDAVVTDIVLPGMHGAELARELRHRWPSLRVLFTSGYAEQSVLASIPRGPGSAFLQKVFTPSELLAAVRALLDAAHSAARAS